MMSNLNKTYSELMKIDSFIDRYVYLSLNQIVSEETFGTYRYLNQILYSSYEWKKIRRKVIIRDKGFELAYEGLPINGYIYVHHINPITINDIITKSPKVTDLENLISTSKFMHNMIHYGNKEEVDNYFSFVTRKPFDTSPWRE